MRILVTALLAASTLALVACAGGGGQPRLNKRQIAIVDRALARAPGAAQPSTIVAAELAFSRAARERGQWTAFREFAAPEAQIHGDNGPFAAAPWLAAQTDPPAAVQWSPRAVVVSCDGSLAVSKGRFRDPDGRVGNFVTVWERQADGEYRYVFDVGGEDNPQPPPKQAAEEGDIIVTAFDMVQGLIASCPRPGVPIVAPPPIVTPQNGKANFSRDGTLRWIWTHSPDGSRYFSADYFYEGRWVDAIEQSLAPAIK